jgi:hypothetical protein
MAKEHVDYRIAFNRADRQENDRHYRAMREIEKHCKYVEDALETQRANGVVHVGRSIAHDIKQRYDINLFDILEQDATRLRRPFIKMYGMHDRTVLRIPNNNWCRSLAVPLLVVAEKYKGEVDIVMLPNGGSQRKVRQLDPDVYFLRRVPLLVDTNKAFMTFIFYTDVEDGDELARDFVERCRTDNHYRIVLGTFTP